MLISFIIVYSSTKHMVEFDPLSWPSRNYELEEKITQHTNKLITQIQSIPIEKEILIMDQTNDFIREGSLEDLQIIPTFQYYMETNNMDNFKIDFQIDDWYHKKGGITKVDHTFGASMAYNHGLSLSRGDYVIFQHNDTYYDFLESDKETLFYELVEYIEENDLQYLTIDKKPIKNKDYPEWNAKIEYYADCYWFMCKSSFYYDNKIWVDWMRGDTNHLATIFCVNNNLKFEHLPGYYEIGKEQRVFWTQKLQNTTNPIFGPNIHTFKDKRFIYHFKGGTGLEGFIKKDDGIINGR
jgi:hypothetical protein